MKKELLLVLVLTFIFAKLFLPTFATEDKCTPAIRFCHDKSHRDVAKCNSCWDKVVTKNCTPEQQQTRGNTKAEVCHWN